VSGGDDSLADRIDIASDATAVKAARGPANSVFDESLGISAADLEDLFKELLSSHATPE
jgi:hypothetical protein